MKKVVVCWVAILFSIFALVWISGCAEFDESESYRIQCGCGQSKEALLFAGETQVPEVWTMDTACEALSQKLVGIWQGQNDSSDSKLILDETGHYKIFERVGKKWVTKRLGKYWVEYEQFQGMLRPELHMILPGGDEYVVRYSLINDNELHLEEPQDGGISAMVFLRTDK
ncbi:MAG: hypothetical protein IJU23_06230 [Proteobacteria bacterium]|nr:hypothetical protein [Pseudomonadota bacterium]